jgi:CRP-like cAMP-binding protein
MKKFNDIGTWHANEIVYKCHSLPECNYLVIEGDVQILAPNGHYLGEVGQGELFGEASFILGTKRSTTVIAGSKGLKAKLIPPQQILQKLEKDIFLNALVRKLEKRLDASNKETVQRSIKIKNAAEQLQILSSEINKFGENIKKDHPDAQILVSKLSGLITGIEKIRDGLDVVQPLEK